MFKIVTYSSFETVKQLRKDLELIDRNIRKRQQADYLTKTGAKKREQLKQLKEYRKVIQKDYDELSTMIRTWISQQDWDDYTKNQLYQYYLNNECGVDLELGENGNIARIVKQKFYLT